MPDPVLPKPDFAEVPRRVNRKAAAALVTKYLFPVSPRSIEGWPLDWLHVNGYALCATAQLFAVAQAKLDAALASRDRKAPHSGTVAESARPHGDAAGRAPAAGSPA